LTPLSEGDLSDQSLQIDREEGINRLAALGFDRALCEKALTFTNFIDVAAQLLLSGDVSTEGLAALGFGTAESNEEVKWAACSLVAGRPDYVARVRAGEVLRVDLRQSGTVTASFYVTAAVLDEFLRRGYGTALGQAADPLDDALGQIFAACYGRLAPHEKDAIAAMVGEGFRFPVVVRMFFGCEKNVAITRASLNNIFH
jgi:hypothetical protein